MLVLAPHSSDAPLRQQLREQCEGLGWRVLQGGDDAGGSDAQQFAMTAAALWEADAAVSIVTGEGGCAQLDAQMSAAYGAGLAAAAGVPVFCAAGLLNGHGGMVGGDARVDSAGHVRQPSNLAKHASKTVLVIADTLRKWTRLRGLAAQSAEVLVRAISPL